MLAFRCRCLWWEDAEKWQSGPHGLHSAQVLVHKCCLVVQYELDELDDYCNAVYATSCAAAFHL